MYENTLIGTYLTRRDGGLYYDYKAIWEDHKSGMAWKAEVRLNRVLVGTPSGIISQGTVNDYPTCVHALVTTSIEALIDVT